MMVRELAPPSFVNRRVECNIIGRRVTTPAEVAQVLQALPMPGGALLRDMSVECFGVLMLSTRRTVQSFSIVALGTLDGAMVHPREVFRAAIASMASAVVLFHNHPSGDPQPSEADARLTERLQAAGIIVGIEVLDHIIIGGDDYHSFSKGGH